MLCIETVYKWQMFVNSNVDSLYMGKLRCLQFVHE